MTYNNLYLNKLIDRKFKNRQRSSKHKYNCRRGGLQRCGWCKFYACCCFCPQSFSKCSNKLSRRRRQKLIRSIDPAIPYNDTDLMNFEYEDKDQIFCVVPQSWNCYHCKSYNQPQSLTCTNCQRSYDYNYQNNKYIFINNNNYNHSCIPIQVSKKKSKVKRRKRKKNTNTEDEFFNYKVHRTKKKSNPKTNSTQLVSSIVSERYETLHMDIEIVSVPKKNHSFIVSKLKYYNHHKIDNHNNQINCCNVPMKKVIYDLQTLKINCSQIKNNKRIAVFAHEIEIEESVPLYFSKYKSINPQTIEYKDASKILNVAMYHIDSLLRFDSICTNKIEFSNNPIDEPQHYQIVDLLIEYLPSKDVIKNVLCAYIGYNAVCSIRLTAHFKYDRWYWSNFKYHDRWYWSRNRQSPELIDKLMFLS